MFAFAISFVGSNRSGRSLMFGHPCRDRLPIASESSSLFIWAVLNPSLPQMFPKYDVSPHSSHLSSTTPKIRACQWCSEVNVIRKIGGICYLSPTKECGRLICFWTETLEIHSRAHAAMTIFWPNPAKTGKIVEWHFRIRNQNQNNDQSSPVKCIGPISHEPSLHFSSDPFTKISFAAVFKRMKLVSSPQPRQLPRLGWWTRACYVLFCISWMRCLCLLIGIATTIQKISKDISRSDYTSHVGSQSLIFEWRAKPSTTNLHHPTDNKRCDVMWTDRWQTEHPIYLL